MIATSRQRYIIFEILFEHGIHFLKFHHNEANFVVNSPVNLQPTSTSTLCTPELRYGVALRQAQRPFLYASPRGAETGPPMPADTVNTPAVHFYVLRQSKEFFSPDITTARAEPAKEYCRSGIYMTCPCPNRFRSGPVRCCVVFLLPITHFFGIWAIRVSTPQSNTNPKINHKPKLWNYLLQVKIKNKHCTRRNLN